MKPFFLLISLALLSGCMPPDDDLGPIPVPVVPNNPDSDGEDDLQPEAGGTVIVVASYEDLLDKLAHSPRSVVMIGTSWCSACSQYKPIFAKAANENKNVAFFQVDGEQVRQAVNAYGIKAYPTTLFFRLLDEQTRLVGVVSTSKIGLTISGM